MHLSDLLAGIPAPASAPEPVVVDHLTIPYFGTVTFRANLGSPTTCDGAQVLADVITDPGGGNAQVLANTAGPTASLTQAEIDEIPGSAEFFTELYAKLNAKIASPPPPEP